jgi:hypothetical protein
MRHAVETSVELQLAGPRCHVYGVCVAMGP